MNDALRSLRLGTISLFGVAVPGFLLIFLATIGLLVPVLALALHLSGLDWNSAVDSLHSDRWLTVGVLLVLSYVAGYILRLSSPDEIDKKSIKHVLANLSDSEREVWPCRGDGDGDGDGDGGRWMWRWKGRMDWIWIGIGRGGKGSGKGDDKGSGKGSGKGDDKGDDKFPYFNFRKYLIARGLKDEAQHVPWGDGKGKGSAKRSKTAVHKMKLDVFLENPDLSDIVDSNEAHIRLMAGTWLAIRTVRLFVIIGAAIALFGFFASRTPCFLNLTGIAEDHAPPYLVLFALNIFIFAIGVWANKRIESLFHYRRVNELVFITMAAHRCRLSTKNSSQDPSSS